jgi:hypothetical protein
MAIMLSLVLLVSQLEGFPLNLVLPIMPIVAGICVSHPRLHLQEHSVARWEDVDPRSSVVDPVVVAPCNVVARSNVVAEADRVVTDFSSIIH